MRPRLMVLFACGLLASCDDGSTPIGGPRPDGGIANHDAARAPDDGTIAIDGGTTAIDGSTTTIDGGTTTIDGGTIAIDGSTTTPDAAITPDATPAPDAMPLPSGEPVAIASSNVDTVGELHVAVDADGDAYVTWFYSTGGRQELWSAHGNAAGWDAPVRLASDATSAALAAAGSVALAVWTEPSASGSITRARRAVAGAWGAVETAQTSVTPRFVFSLAVDASEDAVVLSSPDQFSHPHAYAIRFQPGIGWTNETRLDGADSGGVGGALVALANDGTAYAVWVAPGHTLLESRSTGGMTWDPPTTLATNLWQIDDLSIDPAGIVFVLWGGTLDDGTTGALWERHFDGAWSAPLVVTDEDPPQARIADHVLVRMHQDDHADNHVHDLVFGSHWDGAGWIDPTDLGGDWDLAVVDAAGDAAGRVSVVWERDYTSIVHTAHYDGAWHLTDYTRPAEVTSAAIATGAGGISCVVWREGGGPSAVWAVLTAP